MSKLVSFAVFAIALSVGAETPSNLTTFGGGADGVDARESTWIAYFDRTTERFVGGFSLNYNKVQWQDDYAEQLETILRGKRWRLGKHFWSTLDTNLALQMGGVGVEPGYYYLGLGRSLDGSEWTLLLIDAAAVREERLDAFNVELAPVAYDVPLDFAEADETARELQMYFQVERGEGGVAEGFVDEVELRLHFGPYRLSAPIEVSAAS